MIKRTVCCKCGRLKIGKKYTNTIWPGKEDDGFTSHGYCPLCWKEEIDKINEHERKKNAEATTR